MFERNELVLAWHGPLLYDAIIKDVKQDSSCDSYLVHYQGWNNRWDEWVSGERMLKRNTTNLREQERASAAVDQARKQAKQGKKCTYPHPLPPQSVLITTSAHCDRSVKALLIHFVPV